MFWAYLASGCSAVVKTRFGVKLKREARKAETSVVAGASDGSDAECY